MSARFAPRLALIAVVALAARLIYALVIVKTDVLIGDAREFDTLARNLADGHGYVNPYLLEQGTVRPTAFKPPGYPFALAGVTAVGGGGYVAHHVFTCLLGVVTVVLAGLIGRRVGGDRVGLAAAGIAALYPILIAADGSLRSEALYTMLVAACMWAALRLVDRPTTVRALVLGAFVGLAALTRTEALILLVLLAVPVVGRSPARLRQVAVALAAAVVVIAPWTIRNWSAFDQPVLVSTNDGGVFRGANCDQAYHGPGTGFWFIECIKPTGERNEAKSSAVQRRQGLEYAREHAGRAVVVGGVRVLRTWELYQPRRQAGLGSALEGRPLRFQQLATVVYFLLAALGVAGAVLLRHRHRILAVLLAPVVLVTLSSAISYGFTRFRAGAEPAIVVLAAVAVVAAAQRLAARRGTSTT